MEEGDLKRKLATIMVADIVGYSRLTANDEDWTIRALSEFRGIVDEIIARHDGRIFNTGGDSILAEFASPVEAVRCAVDFQEAARSRNLLQPRDRQLRYRIGINLGDVMVRGNDLLGDGVNVAARLEGLAEPGGICVSGTVWDHIHDKLSVGYVDIGEQSVKNIPRPVHAYHLRLDGTADEVAAPRSDRPAAPARGAGRRSPLVAILATALAAVIVGGGLLAWEFWPKPAPPLQQVAARPAEPPKPAAAPAPAPAPAGAPAATPAPAAPARLPTIRDCPKCPEMVVLPAGQFEMGSAPGEAERFEVPSDIAGHDQPRHRVTFAKPFALARTDVTRGQFAAFVAETHFHSVRGCQTISAERRERNPEASWDNPGFDQTDNDPVVCVGSGEIDAYLRWLQRVTGKPYRLPTEAEWEYAARAGTTTAFYWGEDPGQLCQYENSADLTAHEAGATIHIECRDGFARTAPVASFKPNPWGLYDMLGNVTVIMQDCANDGYAGAPSDGSAWTTGDCALHAARKANYGIGRAWVFRAAARLREPILVRRDRGGFRVALSLP